MSTPVPGRKLSTSDLAAPVARPDTDTRPEAERIEAERIEAERIEPPANGPLVAGPEARRAAQEDMETPAPTPPMDRTDRTDRTDAATNDEEVSALFADDACQTLWKRWDDIQAGFVDEPRRAVQDADSLVAETMQQLANTFARERTNLEQQWGRGDNVSTEDLRIAFRRYRSFFKRLLSV